MERALVSNVEKLRDASQGLLSRVRQSEIAESSVGVFDNFKVGVRNSFTNMGIMDRAGNERSAIKLAVTIVVSVLVIWWVWGLISG